MSLPLHERATSGLADSLVRMTGTGLGLEEMIAASEHAVLIPQRALAEGEQYRFHFNMTKCIGCRSCEIACNEQNGNPVDVRWRRLGEIEGGSYPETQRHYLSMGCNHCLDADCLRGCPVDAYTKDPATGIVLHSEDACIGCQYCVWNCPYGVPQFNPERGVVGKCDMCHGRLTEGLEPACVNACPESAIEIEIVNMAAWRADFSTADSPGMPAAEQTISTTRITLPPAAQARLERVDTGRIRPEHAHASLVLMSTLMQAAVGALFFAAITGIAQRILLTLITAIVAAALNISVFHLGRPAFAWRALKMWRRSWLSREVLLFSLFFVALCVWTGLAWLESLGTLSAFQTNLAALHTVELLTLVLGAAGILASACIYLVRARPAWNLRYTPLDFALSSALLGPLMAAALGRLAAVVMEQLPLLHWGISGNQPPFSAHLPVLFTSIATVAWLANQGLRAFHLHKSSRFEEQASAELLFTTGLRNVFIAALCAVAVVPALVSAGEPALALAAGLGGVLMARYLFFVSVVPLNMATTFIQTGVQP